MFTASRLNTLPRKGKHQHLSVTPPHNPQPLVDGPESYFLYGPSGMPDGMEYGHDGRGRVHDEVYGFWVDNGRGVVVSLFVSCTASAATFLCHAHLHQDLWYWTFYPYNLGKEVGYFGWLGNRESSYGDHCLS